MPRISKYNNISNQMKLVTVLLPCFIDLNTLNKFFLSRLRSFLKYYRSLLEHQIQRFSPRSERDQKFYLDQVVSDRLITPLNILLLLRVSVSAGKEPKGGERGQSLVVLINFRSFIVSEFNHSGYFALTYRYFHGQ